MKIEIHHVHHHAWPEIRRVLENQEKIMAALDNLTAAEANLETVVAAAVTDIQQLQAQLASANTSNDPAIQAVADKLTAMATSLNGVVNPPAAPPSSPPPPPGQ